MPLPAQISLEAPIRQAVYDAIDAGWTIQRIAAECGIPNPMVYSWLSGQRGTSLATMEALAQFFGMRLTKPRIPRAQ